MVVPEKSRLRTRREDEVVEVVGAAGLPRHGFFRGGNGRDLVHQHGDVLRVVENLADGSGDVRSGQRRGGHLVEERLEKMVVGAVEESDVETLVIGELPRALQSRESTANDKHLARCGLLASHARSLAPFSRKGKLSL